MRLPGEIPREQYDRHPGVRWSLLSNMRRSPLHYHHALVNGRQDTPALAFGRALHAAIFEPDTYDRLFVTYAASKTCGAGARRAWIEFRQEAEAKGQTVLDSITDATVQRCAAAVLSNPTARQYLSPNRGRAEIGLGWKDERTGLACKLRADWLTVDGMAVDLKSTRSAELRNFGRSAWHFGYFHQVDFYSRGIGAATGRKPEDVPFLLIAVESDAPHDVSVFEPCPESRHAAREEVDRLLDQLAECERTKKWPGRYTGTQLLKAPAYVLMSEDDDWETTVSEG